MAELGGAVEREDQLGVHRLLGPQVPSLSKTAMRSAGRHEVRRTLVGHRVDERHDGLPGGRCASSAAHRRSSRASCVRC